MDRPLCVKLLCSGSALVRTVAIYDIGYLLVLTRLLVVMLCSYVIVFISQQLVSNLARLTI